MTVTLGKEARASFTTDFMSALTDRTVLLDPLGRVSCLSEAPALITLQTTASQTLLRPGISYTNLCRRAQAAGLEGAETAAESVAAVLRGTRLYARFELRERGRVLEVQVNPLQAESGAVVTHRDITAQEAQLAELQRLAYRDSLTGLTNRNYFFQEAENRLKLAQRTGDAVALVYLDLDNFKGVNDGHGHAAGDAILKVVGERLQRLTRASDLLARLGGDEFVFLLQGVSESGVTALVRRVRHTLRQPVMLAGTELHLEVSVGAALFPELEGEKLEGDIKALLAKADQAMYQVKRSG